MNNRNGVKWSREETILAYDLYCKTPRSKISSHNPEIIALAELLGRTPGAVGLKMHNLAHFDPELREKNLISMAHGSKLDEEIFTEFENDWTELSFLAQQIRAQMMKKEITSLPEFEDITEIPPGEYRERKMRTRVGQYFFRITVLNSYGNKCCVTGINQRDLLIASHIKPWAVSNEKTERTNPSNGLCLNPLHDKAFDRGLITLDSKYNVRISKTIKETINDFL